MSEEPKDIATEIFENLAHSIRQKILTFIAQSPRTYSEIQSFINIERGQLNFHLKKMERLLSKEGTNYTLSKYGLLAVKLLRRAGQETVAVKKRRIFLRRFAAWFIDVFIITAVVLGPYVFDPSYWVPIPFIGMMIPRILVEIVNTFLTIFLIYTFTSIEVILYRISISMILFGYWALFEGYSGQSLGKKIAKIKIKGRRGSLQPMEAAILAFGKAFFLPLDLLGFIIYRKEGSVRITEHITGATVVEEGT